ncbi:hypothetical protein N788_08965 [Arenimonas donghaensis DSM 18148 = HO3-R19]|uniref:Peptidase S1 domain-containing protein n=2 Tax=Arenimonas TaxID=490567 RepID=A0A087MKV3_9GAMM|nr:hypothetical protein N788_08965 [Arenimonas donghaensis DSM 18148 = HO3-R19]
MGLTASGVHGQTVASVAGEPAWSSKAETATQWRAGSPAVAEAAEQAYQPMAPERIAQMLARNRKGAGTPLQIGINRELDEATSHVHNPNWVQVDGGRVARLRVTSSDALAMRAALRVHGPMAGLEFRYSGSDAPSKVEGVLTGAQAAAIVDADGTFWGPVTDGQTQFIEIYAPEGLDQTKIQVEVPVVSHLITSLASGLSISEKIGESGSCNVDTACRVGTLGQNFVDAKNAVAQMIFSKNGGTATCTGTLLNDTDPNTQIPYFFTAHHCISTQSVANTLTTVWNYEATSCNSGVSAATTQRAGGATLLFADNAGPINAPPYEGTDAALFRLNQAPPGFAFFAGWDANVLVDNADVLAIHHPSWDAKKSSLGKQIDRDDMVNYTGWLSGTTEGGSSGSGLFTQGNGGYFLRGGLFGGGAGCENSGDLNNPGNFDIYSRLDVAYPQLQQYLAPVQQSFGPSQGRDYTGAWYVPSEAGWGLTVYQYAAPTYNQFVMFFIYDNTGKAQWFELDATWTATDVRSGTVYASNAAPWSTTFNPNNRSFTAAGTATITYTSATTANVQFTINGVTRSAAIQKL